MYFKNKIILYLELWSSRKPKTSAVRLAGLQKEEKYNVLIQHTAILWHTFRGSRDSITVSAAESPVSDHRAHLQHGCAYQS